MTVRRDGNRFRLGTEHESGGAGLLSNTNDDIKFLNSLTNRGTSPQGVRILAPTTVDLIRTDHLNEQMRSDFNWLHLAGYGLGSERTSRRCAGFAEPDR